MIVLLHPGAMGAAVGAALVSAGHEVVWVSAGRSAETSERASAAGLRAVDSVTVAVADPAVDTVLSICPPHAALDVAREVASAGFRGTYVDANAISPALVRRIADAVKPAVFVDGGIIGGPPRERGTTRLYLAGDRAAATAGLFEGTTLEAIDLGAPPPAASALKMTYAAWTKGTSALLLSARQTAATLGVDDDLMQEWQRSQPELPAQWSRASESAMSKGWRWAFELAEVGRTFAAAGEPEGFGAAASQVFTRLGGNGHSAPSDVVPTADAVAVGTGGGTGDADGERLVELDPRRLGLSPHREGGWFRETYRSTARLDTPNGQRASATAISFLLQPGESSRWHRVAHDELWIHQRGGPIRVTLGGTGTAPSADMPFEVGPGEQFVVPGGTWQRAEPVQNATLVACVVTPGFDFDDFELGLGD